MRTHLVTAVLLLVSCVAAVFLEDAFVNDWVRHNYKSVSRSWLVGPESVLALAESNRLVRLEADSKALAFLVDLAEVGFTDTAELHVVPLDSQFVVFLEQKPQLLVFGKNTGVLANTIELGAAPKKVIPVSNNGLVVLDAHNVLLAWHNGELGTLASSCTSFAVFSQNGVDHVLCDGQILQLFITEDGLEVNNMDISQLGGHVILEADILIDSRHGVSFTQSKVSINAETEKGIEILWSQSIDMISSVHMQTTQKTTYVVVVTPSKVISYDIGKFLKNHQQKTISVSEVEYQGSFSSVLVDDFSISVLSTDESSILVTKQAPGTTEKAVFSIPKLQICATDKTIIVDHPVSLSVLDKAHHMVEDSQTGSDLLRWLKRTKTHLAQFGKAAVGIVSGSPPSSLVHLAKSLQGNIFGLVLGKLVGTADIDADFESDTYGFEKILVLYDDVNSVVMARSTKDGSFIWTYTVGEEDVLVDLISFNSEVYVIFTNSVHVLLLRTGELLLNKKFPVAIDKAIVLETLISEEEAEEAAEPFTLALQSGESFEILHPDAKLAGNQYVVSKTDALTIQGHKVSEGKLIKTWKFTSHGEAIISISNKEGSLTSAVGITRADRSVLYKYLNPNLITVVTKAGTSLKVTLIDGATGNVLHVQSHGEEIVDIKSINVVQADNWVIYSYLVKYPKVEQRIVVLDLFTTAENAIGGMKSATEGEYNVAISQVSTKSFIYPERILELAATQTKFGITLRSVLALTEAGQLVEIPKFLLNSRRIDDRKMTANDFEDEFRMMPYQPVIAHNNYQVLNHKIKLQSVDSDRQILVKPTDFESTAVVCLVNSENEFCTTVQPSLSYDRLTASFDKLKLLLTIGVLFVAYIFTKPLVESKKLNMAWLD